VKGQWFPATAPAAGLILELLPTAQRKPWLLVLLAEMLGADHVRAWLAPPSDALPRDLQEVARFGKDVLLEMPKASEVETRLSRVMSVVDLVPAKRIIEAVVGLLALDDVRSFFVEKGTYPTFLTTLEAIGKDDPSLGSLVSAMKK
jgi:hypothetical protein